MNNILDSSKILENVYWQSYKIKLNDFTISMLYEPAKLNSTPEKGDDKNLPNKVKLLKALQIQQQPS